MAWLAGSLAVPLLRAHFYATETGAGRQTVSYFRFPLPPPCAPLQYALGVPTCSGSTH